MRLHDNLAVVAVTKHNSIGYLDAVFDCYEAGSTVLPVADHADPVPAGLSVVHRQETSTDTGWYRRAVNPRQGAEPAQISLSSGTTGAPKALLLSHRALADVATRLSTAMQLDASAREYVGVPVTFSFGFGRIRALASVGGAAFIPARGFRVDELAGLLRSDEVNSLSAVPTLLRLLIAEREKFRDIGAKLRWLEVGSQSISLPEKQALRQIFPNARILQHYGLTEASRTTFLDISSEEDHLGSVGRPTGSVEIKLLDDGRIAIRGPHLASGIVTADGLQSITDTEGWLVTSDLGHIADGYLYFDGRADDLINVGGVKVPAEAFERAVLARTKPYGEIAVAPMDDALLGQKALVVSTAIADVADKSALRDAVRTTAAEFKVAESGFELAYVEAIPRTETNKVQRRALAALAEPAIHSRAASSNEGSSSVEAVFRKTFGAAADDTGRSFIDFGGDSLSYVRTSLELEAILPAMPEGWEAMSIAELARLEGGGETGSASTPTRRNPGLLLNLDTLRGLACLMIVAVHVIGADPVDGLQLPAGSWWHQIMNNLEFVRLPLFTCLAGIFYGALPAARSGWPGFMSRKLRQFVPPLIFATLVFWGLRRWIYGADEDLLLAFVNGYLHLWYLDTLLVIFAVAAAADLAGGSRSHLLVMTAIASGLLYLVVPELDLLHLRNTLFLFPFFVFGVLLYRFPVIATDRVSLPLALPLTLAYPIAYNILGAGLPGTTLDALLTWTSGAAATVVLLRLMPRIGLLEIISIYSFTIYLWHPAASALVRTLLDTSGVGLVWFLFAIGLLAGVALPIVIHRLADRVPVFGSLLKG